jgi:hypothetical protein
MARLIPAAVVGLLAVAIAPGCTTDLGPQPPTALEPVIAAYRTSGVEGAHVVCGHRTYGSDDATHPTEIYAWVICEAYSDAGTGSAASGPVRLRVREVTGHWSLVGADEPRDGAGYSVSIKSMFPKAVADAALQQRGVRELAREVHSLVPPEFRHFPDEPVGVEPTG